MNMQSWGLWGKEHGIANKRAMLHVWGEIFIIMLKGINYWQGEAGNFWKKAQCTLWGWDISPNVLSSIFWKLFYLCFCFQIHMKSTKEYGSFFSLARYVTVQLGCLQQEPSENKKSLPSFPSSCHLFYLTQFNSIQFTILLGVPYRSAQNIYTVQK